MEVNASLVNFAAGVLSKKFLGRTDLPNFYKAGLLTCRNFYPQAQGPAKFRQGSQYIIPTRLNRDAMMYPFVFNDEQAYGLEFTNKYLRFFSGGSVILEGDGESQFELLSHFNGADAATSYTAETGQPFTFYGNAQLDTAQKVFGASAVLFDGVGDYVELVAGSVKSPGTGDFTVDGRFRFSGVPAGDTIIGSAASGFLIVVNSATEITVFSNWTSLKTFTVTSLNANQWYHIAIVREGNEMSVRVDGVKQGASQDCTGKTYDFNGAIQIGAHNNGSSSPFAGWMDEFAVRNTAVWSADFTVPSAEYSATGVNAITAITQADPGVITISGHGYTGGEQVYISDVAGMTELNNKFYLVVYIDANTFSLTDLDAVVIDTTAYTAYDSLGTSDAVYEIATPYLEADLKQLQFAQKADIMYISHPNYAPRKLIRAGEADWTLATYLRTDDPFTKTISGITKADPGVVTATAHGFSNGDIVQIEDVVGMTEVNMNTYKVANKAANTFELTDAATGANVDTSGYTAYDSVGVCFVAENMPGAVAFYGGRLFFGGTDDEPESFWGSKAPSNEGVTNYDVFTVGTDAEDAVTFPISSQNNTADRIQWFGGTNKFLGIGTFGGVYKANGGSDTDPISGTAINVDALEFVGCKYLPPVRSGSALFYVQRGGLILNKFAYSLLADDHKTSSLNIFSDEITDGGLKQLAVQQGSTDFIWAVTLDGKLLGMTIQTEEEISAWHGPHDLGGTDAKALSVCGEPQSDNRDSLWVVVERTVNGDTRRYVEYIEAEDNLPEREEFYTGVEATDTLMYRKLVYENAKQLLRVDSALSLDQSQPVALLPGAVTGVGVTFTASSDVFSASDVGRYIVRKYVTGKESGRALITAYTSTTEVVCTIIDDFDAITSIAANNWYLTVTTVTGLDHLEGETVRVQIDGADGGEETVTNGAIEIDSPGTVVHVGLQYTGRIQTMPLDIGALVGTAQAKITTVNRLGLLIRNTMGVKYGTRLYDLEQTVLREDGFIVIATNQLLETEVKFLNLPDGYDRRKYVHIVQDAPFPCTIQGIIPYVDTTNE